MKRKRKILYLDMDGVLVDFASGIRKTPPEVVEKYKDNPDEIPGIFALMDPMPGAIEAVNVLSKQFDVYVLSTAPWGNPSAWADKVKFIQKYFPDDLYKRLILTHNKDLCKGDYLVDDRPNHGAEQFEGEWIHFGSNRFPDWNAVVAYLTQGEETDSSDYEAELERVTDAVVKRINQKLGLLVRGDYPGDWDPVDVMAYEWGCLGRSLDEIEPGLEEVIYGFIDYCSQGTVIDNLDEVYNSLIEFLDRKSITPSIQEYWDYNG